jgi:hypothetical protein
VKKVLRAKQPIVILIIAPFLLWLLTDIVSVFGQL